MARNLCEDKNPPAGLKRRGRSLAHERHYSVPVSATSARPRGGCVDVVFRRLKARIYDVTYENFTDVTIKS